MFDIVFAQLGVIPRTRNKFIEIVAVAERHFIIQSATSSKKERIKEAANTLSCKIAWWKNVSKKREKFVCT